MTLTRSLTVWVTPFTDQPSLSDAVQATKQLAESLSSNGDWTPSILVPAHFGRWPQSECRQTMPKDMVIGGAEDVTRIRQEAEAEGVGFGIWGVPVDPSSAELAASLAAQAGYYSANFEPGEFWTPGDDPAAVDGWWSGFWNALPDQDALSGNTAATVVPNYWGLAAFAQSLPNVAAGCGLLQLEVYGGLQTAGEYPSPNLWPSDGFSRVRQTGVQANLVPIIALANLRGQLVQANRLGHGNVHVWCI